MNDKKLEKKKAKREKAFKERTNEMRKFQFIAFAVLIFILLLLLVPFGYVHNTSMNNGSGGSEVTFNGYNLLFAALSNNYSSANKAYGDIAIPFNYYARSYIVSMGPIMIISFVLILLAIAVNVFAFIKNRQELSLISLILFSLIFVLLFVLFIMALSMKNSLILPKYCSNNPACSIRSTAIFPSLVSIIGIIISSINFIQYRKAKILLK